jgi:hypothetical protein
MTDLKMRPRFAETVACDAALLVDTLREAIDGADPPLEGHFAPTHCVLRIPPERRSFWSPELDLTFEPLAEDGGAGEGIRVRCLFAPRPAVWTGFAFVYAVLAAVAVGGALYALAQLTLGAAPRALLVSAGALALLAVIYGASFIGQGLAAGQMYELRRYLDEGLERAAARGRARPRTPFDSARL